MTAKTRNHPETEPPHTPSELETLSVLNRLAIDLFDFQSPDDIAWFIAKEVVAKLGFEDCVVYLLDTERNVLRQTAAIGAKNPQRREIANALIIPVGSGITGSVAATKEPLIVEDLSLDERYIPDLEPALSEICVPLTAKNLLFGVIDCEHPAKGFFEDSHLKTLTTVAAICSAKLDSLRTTKALENAERESRLQGALIDALIEHAPISLSFKEPDGRYRFVSTSFSNAFNAPSAAFIGKTVNDIYSNDVIQQTEEADRRILETKRPFSADEAYPVQLGRSTYLISKFPVLDERGDVSGIGTVGLDITKLQQTENELSKIKQELEERVEARTRELNQTLKELTASQSIIDNLLNSTHEGYWRIDNDAMTIEVNPAMCAILGRKASNIMGRSIFDFVDEENKQVFLREVEARKRGKRGTYEISITRPDGTQVPCINNATPLLDENGNKIGSVGLWTEITEITRAREDADKANRAKSEFLSTMSHELRTPLHAIFGFAQLMELDTETPLTEEQGFAVREILNSGTHLLGLIDQVLDLAKIEAGKLSMTLEPVSLASVCKDCAAQIAPQAKQKRINIDIDVSPEQTITADKTLIKQVLLNLLSNAIKYNRLQGSVIILSTAMPDGTVRLSVRDTGMGVPEGVQDSVFEPFNRLGKEAGTIEGTGIGLTITKRLVEEMSGRIGFDSIPGHGATFWIEFPALKAGATTDAEDARAADKMPVQLQREATVLYVEDNPSNLVLMQKIVARLPGLRLISAPTAEAGLLMAGDYAPDLILLDINLPGMDGFEAKKALAKDRRTQHIPVIAISAAALEKDIQQGLAAGFKAYLTKPFDVSLVLRTIRDQLVETQKGASGSARR